MKDYHYQEMPDKNFGVDVRLARGFKTGNKIDEHWHEDLQILYFTSGKGLLRCNKECFTVNEGDIVNINSREMHYIESLDDKFNFCVIRVNLPFLFSDEVDSCQTKYLAPLAENHILFKNLIKNDSEVLNCVKTIIKEYLKKDIGYELAVKAHLYNLIVLFLRNYIDELITEKERTLRINNFKRFYKVFQYIDDNYDKKIGNEVLSNIANISTCYFCRMFKEITGKTTTEYVNGIRLKKSIELLKTGNMNITEIAINCGFNDVNYFSRVFKRKYSVSPTKFKFQS
ncbi:MAG: AraC family transcriptional regulator [Clostridium sp.]|nr:AraC family transcriptional regulator [Clostridium sp.]